MNAVDNKTTVYHPCVYKTCEGTYTHGVEYGYYTMGVEHSIPHVEDSGFEWNETYYFVYREQYIETNLGYMIYGVEGYIDSFTIYGVKGSLGDESYDGYPTEDIVMTANFIDMSMHDCAGHDTVTTMYENWVEEQGESNGDSSDNSSESNGTDPINEASSASSSESPSESSSSTIESSSSSEMQPEPPEPESPTESSSSSESSSSESSDDNAPPSRISVHGYGSMFEGIDGTFSYDPETNSYALNNGYVIIQDDETGMWWLQGWCSNGDALSPLGRYPHPGGIEIGYLEVTLP